MSDLGTLVAGLIRAQEPSSESKVVRKSLLSGNPSMEDFRSDILESVPPFCRMRRASLIERYPDCCAPKIDKILIEFRECGVFKSVGRGEFERTAVQFIAPKSTKKREGAGDLRSPFTALTHQPISENPPEVSLPGARSYRAVQLCECPYCGAEKLVKCVYPNGRPVPAHDARLSAFTRDFPAEASKYRRGT